MKRWPAWLAALTFAVLVSNTVHADNFLFNFSFGNFCA